MLTLTPCHHRPTYWTFLNGIFPCFTPNGLKFKKTTIPSVPTSTSWKKKYANLVFVYGAQKANRPQSYEQWLRRQKQEMQKLKKTHDNILNHVERYYAEAAVRQIDSDAEIKAEVNSLIKSADIVLQNQFNN